MKCFTKLSMEKLTLDAFYLQCFNKGNHNDEIIIKQEPVEDDEQECFDYGQNACDDSNEHVDISALKEEVKIEPGSEPLTDNVYTVAPQIVDELKRENSGENSSPLPAVCEVWFDSKQEDDEFYYENCQAELGDDSSDENDLQGDTVPHGSYDIMPHFLSGGTVPDEPLLPSVVNCHKCGEVCDTSNFMEHIRLKHKHKPQLARPRRTRKKHEKKYFYPCPYCSKCATTISQLKIHILTHTQEKPHKCPFCDYQGNQAIHVDFHIETKHLNIKRYKCDLCDYSSTTLGCLKKHKIRHRRKSEPRQCPYCQVVTMKVSTLKRHIKKYHKNITS